MDALTFPEAAVAVAITKQDKTITIQEVSGIMNNTDTPVIITTATRVKTAAAHKDVELYKVAKARVLLPANGDTYIRMVKESATALGSDELNVQNYTVGESPYQHTAVYPICELKSNPEKKYLYAIYEETSAPVYLLDGSEVTKEDVANYLTASEAKKLLEENVVTENKTHDIKHSVNVRTISLGNVVDIEKVVE